MRDTTKGPTSRSAFASLAGGFLPAMAPTTQTAKPLVTTQAPQRRSGETLALDLRKRERTRPFGSVIR